MANATKLTEVRVVMTLSPQEADTLAAALRNSPKYPVAYAGERCNSYKEEVIQMLAMLDKLGIGGNSDG